MHICSDQTSEQAPTKNQARNRAAGSSPRSPLDLEGSARTTRFASVVARNVSDHGVYVECHSVVSIPLYRLVQFQLERDAPESDVPATLRNGRVLSALYRVSPPRPTGKPQGLALRLMIDPKRHPSAVEAARQTA